jgi:glycoprotein 6-alpha-L-fucosyltransferase
MTCHFLCLYRGRVHIRRTDKLAAEASFHSVAEYMTYVEDYFSRLELRMPGIERRVFLASDDPTALPEAKKKCLSFC